MLGITPQDSHELISIPIKISIITIFNDFFVSIQYKLHTFSMVYPFFIATKVKNKSDIVRPYPKNILFNTLNTKINKVNNIPIKINIKYTFFLSIL